MSKLGCGLSALGAVLFVVGMVCPIIGYGEWWGLAGLFVVSVIGIICLVLSMAVDGPK